MQLLLGIIEFLRHSLLEAVQEFLVQTDLLGQLGRGQGPVLIAGFAQARMSGEIDAEGVVPEPTSMLLLACGATVALARRRR